MRSERTVWRTPISASIAVMLGALAGGQQAPSSVFTREQATAGASAYAASCASCHMPDLAGRNEAPQLAGVNFRNTWRNRSTRDLLEFMQSTMPPDAPSLPAGDYVALAAYILQRNGATPGSQALTASTAVPIRFLTSP